MIQVVRLIAAAGLLVSASPGRAAADRGQPVYKDAARNIEILYSTTATEAVFSAWLPAGWVFKVNIDGDQDGRWGDGPEGADIRVHPTGDHAFAQDSRNGIFCPQYILSADPQDPTDIYSTTECGGFPSKGHVELGPLDAQTRATITYRIPLAELFGDRPEAHLQVCLWDTRRRICQFTPAKPLVLHRP
ncbi:MAG: hypothetical protein QOH04_2850 [Sphingomonadales bacterium]|jgi:hypothetical protein|nr:hypothetical protein [Sphingomonadales bacterium]MEA3037073.1 hypothetical protein [Sphingomonadales bacterium]